MLTVNNNFIDHTQTNVPEPEFNGIVLPDFIASLIPLSPEEFKDMGDLKMHIQKISKDFKEPLPSLVHHIKNLILNQFPETECCIREIVSNSLDAHTRTHRFEKPIHITIQGDDFRVKDEGDGSTILNLLVPGRSSNPNALFNLKEGIPNVTGRFGQGGLAIYALIYAMPSDISCVPRFFEEDGMPKLELTYIAKDQNPYKIVVDPKFINSSSIPVKPKKRRISIHSYREGETPWKMKFQGVEDQVFFKGVDEKARDKTGMTTKVISPVVGQNNEKWIAYLTKTFKHVSIPLFINNILINDYDHETLSIPGADLYYKTKEIGIKDGGVLRICEGGKLIKEFVLEKGFVPKELTINFSQLPLTHDRNSLDFKDKDSIAIIESLIDRIWTLEMSLQEKGVLLNALYPIVGKKQYNLVGKIRQLISESKVSFFPDTQEFRELNENTGLFLNPFYISSVPYESFFGENNYKLYFINSSSQTKQIAVFPKDGQTHIFLNAKLYSNNSQRFLYNLTLLNQWLKTKGKKIVVDIKKIIKRSFSKQLQSIPKNDKKNENLIEGMLKFSSKEKENLLLVLGVESWEDLFKKTKLVENDFQNLMKISSQEDLPFILKRLQASLYVKVVNLRKSNFSYVDDKKLHQFIFNMDSFTQFLVDSLNEENGLDWNEIYNLYKELTIFIHNAGLLCFNFDSIAKEINECAATQNQIESIEELSSYTPTSEPTLLQASINKARESLIQYEGLKKPRDPNDLKNSIIHTWEQKGLISNRIRPYIYAMLFEISNFKHKNFTYPIPIDPAQNSFLHEDEAILTKMFGDISEFESKDLHDQAKKRIQSATKQTVTEYFLIGELVRNSRQAGATCIEFDIHLTEKGETVLIVKDNGMGMNQDELDSLISGWRVYSCYRDFDEFLCSSSNDCKAFYHSYNQKSEKGILHQRAISKVPVPPPNVSPFKGAIFFFKKTTNSNPLVDFIKLKSEIFSKCRHIRGVEITFQGVPINHFRPTIFHEERDGDFCLQLGKGDEGIYCGDIRLGEIPSSFTKFLPEPLKNMLVEKQIKLRLFIPETKQMMNRVQMIGEDDSCEKSKALIFKALFHYYLQQLKEFSKENKDLLKILSQDYWDNFHEPFKTHDQLNLMIEAIEENKWELLTSQPNKQLKKSILNGALNFLSHCASDTVNEVHACMINILKKDEAQNKKEAIEKLSTTLNDPKIFAQLLANTPLTPFDPNSTLMKIREKWKYVLVNEHILKVDNYNYDSNFICSCSEEYLRSVLERCRQIVDQYVSERDKDYAKNIMHIFKENILSRCLGIRLNGEIKNQVQENQDIDFSSFEKNLTEFSKQLAKHFNKEINVKFYSNPNGANAYVLRGINTIFINKMGLFQDYLKIFKCEYLSEQRMKAIIDVIETIVHELVHLHEEKDCQHTHDTVFRDTLADFLEQLFISKDKNKNILSLGT